MPSRILREGILTSERVDSLASWASEVFYRRLMSVIDDFGRYYANPSLLRAACYPLRLDKVSNADVEKWLADCARAALVSTYEVDGKRYLQMLDFRQQERAKHSKFPAPPSGCAADAQQKLRISEASAPVVEDESGDEGESTRARKKGVKTPIPADFGISDRVRAWAKSKGYGDLDKHLEAFRLKVDAHDYRYANWDSAFMGAIEDDWAEIRSGKKSAPGGVDAWWVSDEGIQRKGGELGMTPKPGETMASYRDRIKSRISQARTAA